MKSGWGPLVNPFVAMAIAVIGVIDAAVGGSWDLAVLFGLLFATFAALTVRTVGNRRWLRLRGDLAQWIDGRAAEAGETAEDVVDRAVAAYRGGLSIGPIDGAR